MTVEVVHRSSYAVGGGGGSGSQLPSPGVGSVTSVGLRHRGSVASVDVGTGDVRFDAPEVTYFQPGNRRAARPDTKIGASIRFVDASPEGREREAPGMVAHEIDHSSRGGVEADDRSPTDFRLPERYLGFQGLLD